MHTCQYTRQDTHQDTRNPLNPVCMYVCTQVPANCVATLDLVLSCSHVHHQIVLEHTLPLLSRGEWPLLHAQATRRPIERCSAKAPTPAPRAIEMLTTCPLLYTPLCISVASKGTARPTSHMQGQALGHTGQKGHQLMVQDRVQHSIAATGQAGGMVHNRPPQYPSSRRQDSTRPTPCNSLSSLIPRNATGTATGTAVS